MKFLVSARTPFHGLRIVDPHIEHVYTGSYTMFEVSVDKKYDDTLAAFHIAVRQVLAGVFGLDYANTFVVFSDSGVIRDFRTTDGYDLEEISDD